MSVPNTLLSHYISLLQKDLNRLKYTMKATFTPDSYTTERSPAAGKPKASCALERRLGASLGSRYRHQVSDYIVSPTYLSRLFIVIQLTLYQQFFYNHSESSLTIHAYSNSDSMVDRSMQVCSEDFHETVPPSFVNI